MLVYIPMMILVEPAQTLKCGSPAVCSISVESADRDVIRYILSTESDHEYYTIHISGISHTNYSYLVWAHSERGYLINKFSDHNILSTRVKYHT